VPPFSKEIPLYLDGSGDDGVDEAAAADPGAVENADLPGNVPADGASADDGSVYRESEAEKTSNDADMDSEGDAGVDEGLAASSEGEADGGED